MSTPQSIQEQLQSLEPSAIIELFQLQLTAAVNGIDTTFFYHAGTNELGGDVVFNGLTYQAVPVEVEGFDVTSKGQSLDLLSGSQTPTALFQHCWRFTTRCRQRSRGSGHARNSLMLSISQQAMQRQILRQNLKMKFGISIEWQAKTLN